MWSLACSTCTHVPDEASLFPASPRHPRRLTSERCPAVVGDLAPADPEVGDLPEDPCDIHSSCGGYPSNSPATTIATSAPSIGGESGWVQLQAWADEDGSEGDLEMSISEDTVRPTAQSTSNTVRPPSTAPSTKDAARSTSPPEPCPPISDWWSAFAPDDPKVVKEFGGPPPTLSTVLDGVITDQPGDVCPYEVLQKAGVELAGEESYMALDLHVGARRIVVYGHVAQGSLAAVKEATQTGATSSRLKLSVIPVNISIPVPVHGPATAGTLESFYGKNHTSSKQWTTPSGGFRAVVMVDLLSTWMMRTLIPRLAFTEGRQIDLYLSDWHQRVVVSGFRLRVTPQALKAFGK
mmetsp:Transcript_30476/g.68822  ORF Transcript_30476/g.68822 Transcript_30476/m.68822 type:complete len:351 (+) Transcript_30476:41-1093(+)